MGLWMAWMEKAGPAIVDGGSPLGDPTVLPSNGGQGDRQVGGVLHPAGRVGGGDHQAARRPPAFPLAECVHRGA